MAVTAGAARRWTRTPTRPSWGTNVWSPWHRLWLQNTGNADVWMGDWIVANTWDQVANCGTHTCANRWL